MLNRPLTLRRVEQPQHHVHRVPDPDEIPLLLAVRQAGHVGAEQLERAAGGDLVVLDLHHGDHRSLVVLVRAIDVEELQARPLRRPVPPAASACHPQVERVLGPAVQVQRPQLLQRRTIVVEPRRAVAIGRGRGGIDEAHLARRAPVPQAPAARRWCARQVAVGRGGLADGAHVEHHLDRRAGRPGTRRARPAGQPRGRVLGEVAPLVAAGRASPRRSSRARARPAPPADWSR